MPVCIPAPGQSVRRGRTFVFWNAIGTETRVPASSVRRCSGKTLQSVFRNRALSEIPAARATVKLRSRFQLREQISGEDGSYSFDDVPPGDYEIFAALPRFRQTPIDGSLTIVPGGCAYRLFKLKPETRPSGDAVYRDGTPVRNTNASFGNPSFARGEATILP